jgi:hypothetical protein
MGHTHYIPVMLIIDPSLLGKIKRIEQLCGLLRDPEIAAFAQELLTERNGAPVPDTTKLPSRPESVKRGTLPLAAMDVLKESPRSMSARDVMHALEAKGFQFEASNHHVSVSKALRSLAKKGKIEKERSGPGKAALLYKRKSTVLFPVQERAQ